MTLISGSSIRSSRNPVPAGILPLRVWVVCVIAACTGMVQAQLPVLKQAVESLEGKPAADAKPAKPAESMSDQLKARKEVQARLETGEPPAGITPSEVETRRYHLDQTVLLLERLIKNSGALAEARKKTESAKAAEAAWQGFKEKPPYSILMLDALLNERDAIQSTLGAHTSSLSNAEGVRGAIVAEAKAADSEMGVAVQVLKNAPEGEQEASRWRLEAAEEKFKFFTLRVAQIEDNCATLRERILAAKSDLKLVERKIAATAGQVAFTDADMAKLKTIRDERKAALNKEIDACAKRLKSAVLDREKAQAAVEALAAKAAGVKPADGKPVDGELETARFRLDLMDFRLDAAQSIKETLDYQISVEDSNVQLYQVRRDLMEAPSLALRSERYEDIQAVHAKLKALESVLENEVAGLAATVSNFEARASSIATSDPRFPMVNDHRAASSERMTALQRLLSVVTTQRRLARRWVDEFAPPESAEGWTDRTRVFGSKVWSAVKKVWGFELTHFEETVELDGKTLTSRRPFTLGTLLKAVLFFTLGYVVLSRIARRIQSIAVGRGHIADAQARTLRNWGMILAGFFLILGTFQLLKIPLTVFAFLGGAMAIGVGIGTQNIIKNFVSGIILLAERKIRVGDVLEVDGFIGKVTEINTRSSVVRSADDFETVVPNSVFLENRVTNWTLTNAKVRRVLQVGVAYGSPVQLVMDTLTESAGRHGLVCKDPAPFAVFQDFGDSALMFHLYYWLDMRSNANGVVVASDLRLMIEKRFAELRIGVPFPQRDLRLSADSPLRVLWAKDTEPGAES